jgi:hypothetical protein
LRVTEAAGIVQAQGEKGHFGFGMCGCDEEDFDEENVSKSQYFVKAIRKRGKAEFLTL